MYLLEKLTVRAWLFQILPRIVRDRVRRPSRAALCEVLQTSRAALRLARVTGRWFGLRVGEFNFQLLDLRDESGALVWIRLAREDMHDVLKEFRREPLIQELRAASDSCPGLTPYLEKSLLSGELIEGSSLMKILILVQAAAWKGRRLSGKASAVVFLEPTPWLRVVQRYGMRHGVRVESTSKVPSENPHPRPLPVRERESPLLGEERARVRSPGAVNSDRHGSSGASGGRFRVAVESYEQFNVDRPEKYSDLFFWQRSSLEAHDLLVIFGLPSDPLDETKWGELKKQGFPAIALHPGALSAPQAPLFSVRPRYSQLLRNRAAVRARPSTEKGWLARKVREYDLVKAYWTDLFDSEGVRVYVSWFNFDPKHCAIADALYQLGGVTALYQRSSEGNLVPSLAGTADVFFGFSRNGLEAERRAGSLFRYYVVTGYLGDHRFPLLRTAASKLQAGLRSRGATRILAHFDENSLDDSRWHTGHHFMRENYAFLLEKVIREPWFGLVLKPKTPRTLRQRLGPVAPLLKEAESTGRCYLFEDGTGQSSYPPAAAALASDLAVHGHLWAGTAGMESALAGVPTLLLDREGWPASPLYRLGVGKVVFRDWETLWQACLEHWNRPGGIPGFGDWSGMLEEIDPFRDGRAAERMGTYLKWLVEGFKAGQDREAVMACAAERYRRAWGTDKVIEPGAQRPHPICGLEDSPPTTRFIASRDAAPVDHPLPAAAFQP